MSLHLARERYLPHGLSTRPFPDPGKGPWGVLFQRMWDRWGDPYWWPGRDAWEVAAGAVLTQNTAWKNVEKALAALRSRRWTTARAILDAPREELAEAIRPSGYFNAKTRKLAELARWWIDRVESGDVSDLSDAALREELLAVWGVGPETADAIACYALGRPLFVVDAYTLRMVERLRGLEKRPSYDTIQAEVHDELPHDPMLYSHLHGLIVVLGKEHCTARHPDCPGCPLLELCRVGQANTRATS